ncbi:Las1 family protein, partial [Cardiosporidium cionae]
KIALISPLLSRYATPPLLIRHSSQSFHTLVREFSSLASDSSPKYSSSLSQQKSIFGYDFQSQKPIYGYYCTQSDSVVLCEARMEGPSVPWYSWGELKVVYQLAFSADPEHWQSAINKILAWENRQKLPVAIDSTVHLLQMMTKDAYFNTRTEVQRTVIELRLSYALVIIRLVNHLVEHQQMGAFARSVREMAAEINLPSLLVDIRHQATHSDLPSLFLLRNGVTEALCYLKEKIPQIHRLNVLCDDANFDTVYVKGLYALLAQIRSLYFSKDISHDEIMQLLLHTFGSRSLPIRRRDRTKLESERTHHSLSNFATDIPTEASSLEKRGIVKKDGKKRKILPQNHFFQHLQATMPSNTLPKTNDAFAIPGKIKSKKGMKRHAVSVEGVTEYPETPVELSCSSRDSKIGAIPCTRKCIEDYQHAPVNLSDLPKILRDIRKLIPLDVDENRLLSYVVECLMALHDCEEHPFIALFIYTILVSTSYNFSVKMVAQIISILMDLPDVLTETSLPNSVDVRFETHTERATHHPDHPAYKRIYLWDSIGDHWRGHRRSKEGVSAGISAFSRVSKDSGFVKFGNKIASRLCQWLRRLLVWETSSESQSKSMKTIEGSDVCVTTKSDDPNIPPISQGSKRFHNSVHNSVMTESPSKISIICTTILQILTTTETRPPLDLERLCSVIKDGQNRLQLASTVLNSLVHKRSKDVPSLHSASGSTYASLCYRSRDRNSPIQICEPGDETLWLLPGTWWNAKHWRIEQPPFSKCYPSSTSVELTVTKCLKDLFQSLKKIQSRRLPSVSQKLASAALSPFINPYTMDRRKQSNLQGKQRLRSLPVFPNLAGRKGSSSKSRLKSPVEIAIPSAKPEVTRVEKKPPMQFAHRPSMSNMQPITNLSQSIVTGAMDDNAATDFTKNSLTAPMSPIKADDRLQEAELFFAEMLKEDLPFTNASLSLSEGKDHFQRSSSMATIEWPEAMEYLGYTRGT